MPSEGAHDGTGFTQAFDTIPSWDFTFFAPSNEAFENTGQYYETYAKTQKGKWWLGDLLQHHYIPNTKLPTSAFNETEKRIQTGTYMFISAQKTGDTLTLNSVATVTEADLQVERVRCPRSDLAVLIDLTSSQGVVHIIDHILNPAAQIYNVDLPRVSQRFIAGSCSNPLLPYC